MRLTTFTLLATLALATTTHANGNNIYNNNNNNNNAKMAPKLGRLLREHQPENIEIERDVHERFFKKSDEEGGAQTNAIDRLQFVDVDGTVRRIGDDVSSLATFCSSSVTCGFNYGIAGKRSTYTMIENLPQCCVTSVFDVTELRSNFDGATKVNGESGVCFSYNSERYFTMIASYLGAVSTPNNPSSGSSGFSYPTYYDSYYDDAAKKSEKDGVVEERRQNREDDGSFFEGENEVVSDADAQYPTPGEFTAPTPLGARASSPAGPTGSNFPTPFYEQSFSSSPDSLTLSPTPMTGEFPTPVTEEFPTPVTEEFPTPVTEEFPTPAAVDFPTPEVTGTSIGNLRVQLCHNKLPAPFIAMHVGNSNFGGETFTDTSLCVPCDLDTGICRASFTSQGSWHRHGFRTTTTVCVVLDADTYSTAPCDIEHYVFNENERCDD